MLDPGNLQGGGGGVVRARLDLCDLKRGLTIVSGAGPASCLHLGQEALHRIPMAEPVLCRCVFVESSCHGQGHLNLLARLSTEVAITSMHWIPFPVYPLLHSHCQYCPNLPTLAFFLQVALGSQKPICLQSPCWDAQYFWFVLA